jgi:hypothetical protein
MKINTCNYVYLISNYLIAILQIMNITLSESYTNNLINTKCLNTAVMLIVILIGQKKIPCIQQCDVGNTIQRHIQSIDNNNTIADKLMKSVCRASKKPYVYYIMLTDGQLNHKSSNQTIYFPGHVFILEKTNNKEYLIYQSFIGKYDLRDYVVKNKCKKFTVDEVKEICTYFKRFLSIDYVWDGAAVKNWMKLTGVDTSQYIDYKTNNIFLCFRKFNAEYVEKRIKKFVKTSLKEIDTNIKKQQLNKYDSNNHHFNKLSAKGYTIFELRNRFEQMFMELNSL